MISLLQQLRDFVAHNAYERTMQLRLQTFLESTRQQNPFARELAGVPPEHGHVTGSAWIVNPAYTRVVMLHHAKLGIWVQPGGHCDDETNVLAVAQREASEETGLYNTSAITGIFDVDIHHIPEYWNTPAHLHYDVRYLLVADDAQPLICSHESKAVRWMSLDEALELSGEESIARMVRKTLQLGNDPKNHLR